jgi:hypothetical protein
VTLARWGTPLAVFGWAAALFVWPHPLSWTYSYAAIESVRRITDPRLWLGAAVMVLAALGLYWSYRRRSPAFVGIGIFLITFSIVSNTLERFHFCSVA